jgi:hypothetical protein
MLAPEQAAPQPPQLVALKRVLTSQPSICLLPLQSSKPGLQAPTHWPTLHEGITFCDEQTSPQAPQFDTSAPRFTQPPQAFV